MKAIDKFNNWQKVELEIISSDETHVTFTAGGGPEKTLAPPQFNAAYQSVDSKAILPTLAKAPPSSRPAAGSKPAVAPPGGSPSSPATLAHVRELHFGRSSRR